MSLLMFQVRVKVFRLRVIDFYGHHQYSPSPAIVHRYLRTVAKDSEGLDQIDWRRQSALTELHCSWRHARFTPHWALELTHPILMRAPHSVEPLSLCVDARTGGGRDMVRRTFGDRAWKNLPLLRSFTLQIRFEHPNEPVNIS